MGYQVLLGPSQWDAVAYVRAIMSDTAAPFTVPDSTYEVLQEDVLEDFSRYSCLDYVVGNPALNTSPLVTVLNQQRYVCSVANGFTVTPRSVTDVTYAAIDPITNTTDWGAWNLMPFPFSPLGRYFLTNTYIVDNPSLLTLRSEYRDSLDRLWQGSYDLVRDPTTGLWAIDLYPIPGSAGLPIYVRYQGQHIDTGSAGVNAIYATVPEAYKRYFAELLYCKVAEQALNTFATLTSAKVGIIQQGGSVDAFERIVQRREKVYQQLGGSAPVVAHTA